MKKDGKRITRFKTGATKLQGASYLREMAEQGWILEEMNHITYSFREDEPQYLRYRLEEAEHALTTEERENLAKDGWQEVCHYELEYVFVKEREPFEEEIEEEKEEIIKDIDRRIEQEQKNEREGRYAQLIIAGIGFISVFLILGFSKESGFAALRLVIKLMPWILIAYFGSRRRLRKLHQEKEAVMEGDISDEYTDWRKGRRMTIIWVLVLVLFFAGWGFYAGGHNEKWYPLPKDVSYKEIPAVRLENLIEGNLTRVGESVDPRMEGIRLNAEVGKGNIYEARKKMGAFENYVVDHRFLLKTKEKVETYQCMQTEDGIELNLDADYYYFRDIRDAGSRYIKLCVEEERMDAYWREQGMDFPPSQKIPAESERIDNIHVCRTEWPNEIDYHVVANKGSQVMELNYSGKDIDVKRLLFEIARVFDAQYYK